MAEESDGCLLTFGALDDDEIFWEEVRKKAIVRQRSERSDGEYVETVVKKSKADGGSLNARSKDEVWKVVVVFVQKGGARFTPNTYYEGNREGNGQD